MNLSRLWLTDFRNYASADVAFAPDGLTLIVGDNGEGKTNLLEAVGWLATMESFRGAPPEAMIRSGASMAIVRAEGERDRRDLLLEAQLGPRGRTKVLVNRQPLRRSRDLLGAFRVSVFAPDDLGLVKEGPASRRRYLDDLLVACHPRWDKVRGDVDRTLRQRATLLKQAGGRLTPDAALTLDVWDAKLAEAGEELTAGRVGLLDRLAPAVGAAYDRVAGRAASTGMALVAPWRAPNGPGLAEALAQARSDDVRRGVSTVGPHRDDVLLTIDGMPARTHASQGEQRSLALALRLGGHEVVTADAGARPLLLLDDVFSELDPGRSAALIACLPSGQALLTTAGPVPPGIHPALTLHVKQGAVVG